MRYISESSISFSLKVKGREDSIRVSFIPLSSGGSTYSTSEVAVMEALEKSPMYGKVYDRAPECMNDSFSLKKTRTASPKKKVVQVDSVSGWQEAVEYLVENFGSNTGKMVTPDEILKEAEARGVVFTRLV
jgi:hypothetical protein